MSGQRAGIGFSDHSGWAVLAIVRDAGPFPELVLRRRVLLCPPELPRQAYHAVAEQGWPRSVVGQVAAAVAVLCGEAIGAARDGASVPVIAAGIAIGRTPLPPDLDRILAAHTLLHAAEGELYRDALAEAAGAAGLRVVRFLNREVRSEAAAALGMPLADLEGGLSEMGKSAGRPWTKDEKDATAAAMLALSTVSSR